MTAVIHVFNNDVFVDVFILNFVSRNIKTMCDYTRMTGIGVTIDLSEMTCGSYSIVCILLRGRNSCSLLR